MSTNHWKDGQYRLALQRCKTPDAAAVLHAEFNRVHAKVSKATRSRKKVSGNTASSLNRPRFATGLESAGSPREIEVTCQADGI